MNSIQIRNAKTQNDLLFLMLINYLYCIESKRLVQWRASKEQQQYGRIDKIYLVV